MVIIGWTALIGVNDLFALAAGGMFYVAVTDLVLVAQARHYQQSAGLATAVGFLFALAFASAS